MNSQVSIDVDMLEHLPAKTLLALVQKSQDAKKHAEANQRTIRNFSSLFRRLEELDIDISFDLGRGDIDLRFSGDGDRLKTIWAELRKNGYAPDLRPEKGKTEFHSFWRQEGYSNVWMSFSSTLCRRVQIGTEMVEQPIYEIQCGELPALEAPSQEIAVIDASNELPF